MDGRETSVNDIWHNHDTTRTMVNGVLGVFGLIDSTLGLAQAVILRQ
jgi:hypothetical protein